MEDILVDNAVLLGIFFGFIFGPLISIGCCVWGYLDAKKRDCNEVIVAVMFLLLGPLAFIIWFLRRPPLLNKNE
jgi:hypothetical protein